MVEWQSHCDLQLVYDPQSRGTFRSARWGTDSNPDLVFTTKNVMGTPLAAQREVLKSFPNSQHRLLGMTLGLIGLSTYYLQYRTFDQNFK